MQNVLPLREIRSQVHSEIAEIISQDASLLVDEWVHSAETQEDVARETRREVLRNDLLGFLQSMGAALGHLENSYQTNHQQLAKLHGEQRWEKGWTVGELITDYQLLRIVVTEHLNATLGRSLTHDESISLGVMFDDAIAFAVNCFENHQIAEAENSTQQMLKFVGCLGHELRNPLNSISMAIELISRTDQKEFRDQASLVMGHGIEQLNFLVSEMLDVSRIIRGDIQLHRQNFDLRDAIIRSLESVQLEVGARKHDLQVVLPDTKCLFEGDAARIQQVFSNLLNNAVKYTSAEGQIHLTFSDCQDGHYEVSIRDNGKGIAPEMLSGIFELFSRGHVESDGEDGLGIGLSIVKLYVELHGGRIQVRSDGVNQGSEFKVILPRSTSSIEP